MSVPSAILIPRALPTAGTPHNRSAPHQHPHTRLQEEQYETPVPTVADRVVQAALKLVLEPIFEADFAPVSYGFRPNRRAHDAIAEIHFYGTLGYRQVLDADIEACFDSIDHAALMDRVRRRVTDKRVLALVKAFLKAGVMTETGNREDSDTGTPQGGILSPVLANIALTALDEHLMAPWKPGGPMSTQMRRRTRRRKELPNWRLVRYADDFVVLVRGDLWVPKTRPRL
jgi:RNA-directed DNA polymerase